MMNRTPIALAAALLAAPALAQDDEDKNKWKPYQFKGNERYEYKMVTEENDEKKEIVYVLDIRQKGDGYDVTWSIKTAVKKDELGEKTLWGAWGTLTPTWTLMNPMYGAFVSQMEIKEGEKMSLFGAGVIKVTGKETVGGRTGLTCKLFTKEKEDDKDSLAWEWTVDKELALPIKSLMYENGKEKSRAELVSYKKD